MRGPHVHLGATAPCLFHINPYNSTMIIVTIACFTVACFNDCFLLKTENFSYLFYIEKFITQFKTTEKMIGRHTRFQENNELLPWQGSAATKKLPFFNAHVLMTHEIMRSRDAQYNTGE